MNRHETLKRKYAAEIAAWDWPGIVADAKDNAKDADIGEPRVFLGTVMALYPSGKYHTPWCSNQTSHDEQRDEAFEEALEEKAAEFGGWIESGDGDPCDLLFVMNAEEGDDNANEAKDEQAEAGTSAE